MKILYNFTFLILVALVCPAIAQDTRTLVKEGIELNNAKNYSGAIEKYKAALLLEPENVSANYQFAFALNASGKGLEAMPYLEKVTAQSSASTEVLSSAYSLMGGIYDKAGQAQKAVDAYKKAIDIDSGNAILNYNLGLAYFRAKQFANAEKSAVAALKTDPKHAASMRLYALVTFHQNERAPALLALCTFLWMEPNGNRADEAFSNLQSILKGGVLRVEPVVAPLNADNKALNLTISQAVEAVDKRRYVMTADPLTEQLTAIFGAIGKVAAAQKTDAFFSQMAARYLKLAQSGNVPAFARYIRQGVDKDAADWVSKHPREVSAMQAWITKSF